MEVVVGFAIVPKEVKIKVIKSKGIDMLSIA